MLGILPAIVFFLSVLRVRCGQRDDARCWREAMLVGAVGVGVWVVLGTEILSWMGLLVPGAVIAWWLVAAALLGASLGRERERLAGVFTLSGGRPKWLDTAGLSVCVLIAGAAFVVAALSPINNWDSLNYHMPRVFRWAQQHSVAHYPTHSVWQLMFPPFAEYSILHEMLLSGGDQWSNLVQWSAFPLTAAGTSLIARELGAGRRGQVLAAALTLANAQAYMWATNTKNDLILALWLCIASWVALRIARDRRLDLSRGAMAGAAIGLAVLTKSTALMILPPILILLAAYGLRARGRRALGPGLLIIAIALALNAPHMSRNQRSFGSVLGPTTPEGGGFAVGAQTHSPAAIASAVLRRVALHVGTPWPRVNDRLGRFFIALHGPLGVSANDARTTLDPKPPWGFQGVKFNLYEEDVLGSPLLMGLGLAIAPALCFAPRRRIAMGARMYAIVPYGGFVLLAAALKWSPFDARYHIPVECLFAPLGAVVIAPLWRGIPGLLVIGGAVALLVPTALWNVRRPLTGPQSVFVADRAAAQFRDRPNLLAPTSEMARLAREIGAARVGLFVTFDEWEYPLEGAIRNAIGGGAEVYDFNAEFPRGLRFSEPAPDLVIAMYAAGRPERLIRHQGSARTYRLAGVSPPYAAYTPEPTLAEVPLEPQFSGWDTAEGLDPIEGPYPQMDLPRVRWGTGAATMIRFQSDGGAKRIVLRCRGNTRPEQQMTVRLNGQELTSELLGAGQEFHFLVIPAVARQGENRLRLEYVNTWGDRKLAVLFSVLRIEGAGVSPVPAPR
jgi:Dolichyl-phosphate-mannose-protein mannosyltransferase